MDSKVRVRRGGVADLPGQWRIVACTENAAKDVLACHPADRLQKEARSFVREGARKVPDHGGSERDTDPLPGLFEGSRIRPDSIETHVRDDAFVRVPSGRPSAGGSGSPALG